MQLAAVRRCACVARAIYNTIARSKRIDVTLSLVRSHVLDLVTRHRFPSPCVCRRQIRVCKIARVRACVPERMN